MNTLTNNNYDKTIMIKQIVKIKYNIVYNGNSATIKYKNIFVL